ncbi:MAG: aminotransferase class I/II-fold pyridoxal phosphate-dependent enzyme [Elainellaceae cyanobacterium]
MSHSLSHADMPLLDALRMSAARSHAPFYAPGHKRGQGIPTPLAELLGISVFRADLPELPELDTLFAPDGVIQQAQELAADAFGSDRTWFLANGSTCGIEAALLATCNPGDSIIVPRNAHQSVISGLILSGAVPIFVQPQYDPDWDIAHSVTPEAIARALAQHPDAKAVMVVYPTYYGTCGNLEAIAQITHDYDIPLLVDEAHGAHFAFHPDLPTPALQAGADLTVQSTHKTLAAMTQASMLHVKGDRVSVHRLSNALRLVQSTSPSYLLLASLDAARSQMALQGAALMAHTLDLAQQARSPLHQRPDLRVLDLDHSSPFAALDPTRLTVDVTGLGLTGFEADDMLHHHLAVTAELPTLRTLTFIISLGNTQHDIQQLVEAFRGLACRKRSGRSVFGSQLSAFSDQRSAVSNQRSLSPRDAFFADTQSVAIAQAANQISAELVCPYPPGIPILFPGELISEEAIQSLQHVLDAGGLITGCADPTLQTLQIIGKH